MRFYSDCFADKEIRVCEIVEKTKALRWLKLL